MKIVLISGDQYPFFIDTVNELAKRGHELHVFNSRELGNTKGIEKLNSHVIFHPDLIGKLDSEDKKSNIFFIPVNIRKFKKKLDIINPDILHAFNLKWSGWFSALSNFHPFILTGLGSDILKEQRAEKNLVIKKLRSITIKRADFITVVSKQMEKQVKEVNPNAKTCFFAPGANPEKFKYAEAKDKTKYRFNNYEYVIFSPRAMKPIYQTKEIVLAFVEFQKKMEKAILIIGGATNSVYAKEVIDLVKKKEIAENVFFSNRASHEEWLEYYRISDVVVSFPYNDGMPATIFEAMATKTALILSDVPSVRQIVSHDKNAYLCNKDDFHSLVKGFEKILTNIDYRNNLVENAFQTFNEKGNSLKFVDELENIYKQIRVR